MGEPTSFHSNRLASGPGSGRAVALISVLAVGLIGVAIAKPWGMPAPASPAPGASSSVAVPSSSTIVADVPTPTLVTPAPDAISGVGPAPVTAAWTAVRWRLLAPDDSVSLVRAMLGSRGELIAVGGDPSGAAPTTPLWTSRDGHTGSRCPSLSLCP